MTEAAAASTEAPAPGPDSAAIAPAGTGELTPNQAAKMLADMRWKRTQPENSSAVSAEPATAETELSPEDNAAPPEEATGETQEDAPAETPSRALPRSWTKDQNDRWAKLDPEMQDFLLEQDSKASKAIRQSQNEAADKLKGLTAKEQAAEQARQQYEAQAKAAYQVLLREQQREFSDVKTMDDVRNMAQADPLRYLQWQAHQQDLQVQAAAVQQAEQRSASERQGRLDAYSKEQADKLKEMVPDFADADKLAAATKRAMPMLKEDYGWSQEQLAEWASTEVGFKILFSAGFQKLVADQLATKDREAARAAAIKAPLAKAVPPVNRPGARPPQGQAQAQNVQNLSSRLTQSGSIDDAVALYAARQANRRPV